MDKNYQAPELYLCNMNIKNLQYCRDPSTICWTWIDCIIRRNINWTWISTISSPTLVLSRNVSYVAGVPVLLDDHYEGSVTEHGGLVEVTPLIRAENGPICGFRIINSHHGKLPFEVIFIIYYWNSQINFSVISGFHVGSGIRNSSTQGQAPSQLRGEETTCGEDCCSLLLRRIIWKVSLVDSWIVWISWVPFILFLGILLIKSHFSHTIHTIHIW